MEMTDELKSLIATDGLLRDELSERIRQHISGNAQSGDEMLELVRNSTNAHKAVLEALGLASEYP